MRGQAACAPIAFVPLDARSVRARASSWFRHLPLASVFLVGALGVMACGGDDTSGTKTTPTDAGIGTGGTGTRTDGGSKAGSGGGQSQNIPRRDAQVAEDPIAACDLESPSCPSGDVCDVLLRRAAGATEFTVKAGCVKAGRERAEGDPCDLDPTNDGEPYMVAGLTEIVYREPCGPGLVCAPSSRIRGGYSCQRFCSAKVPCPDATSLCSKGPILPYCRKSDGCNAVKQTGCAPGEACYLVPSDDEKQLLALCVGTAATVTPDGTPGCAPNSCNPGSVCLGPVRMPISAWTDTNVVCRRLCNGEMGTAPATSDEDAGVPVGLCNETTRCEPYSASGLLLSSISSPPFGQCEK
jgi:hypothetical protein